MKPHEIKALFPIRARVTDDILKSSVLDDRNNCIACKLLKSVLPEELWELIDWGTGIGRIDGIPVRAKKAENKDGSDHYLQFANTKIGDEIIFVIDKR